MHAQAPLTTGSILIVEEEEALRETLTRLLRQSGYRVASVTEHSEALQCVTHEQFDLILANACMPGKSGLELLRRVNERCSAEDVVIMSAYATIDQTVEAMRLGATDYLTKPFQLHELAKVVERVMARRHEQSSAPIGQNGNQNSPDSLLPRRKNARRSRGRRVDVATSSPRCETPTPLIGSSPVMKQLLAIIDRIGPTDSSVLITGATGTGKELVARAIHERSRRSEHLFVDINCSAIPETLIEAELFGHQRGTFTGAHETRRGLFEAASGGTIFLDEVDALDLSAQAKLLRVLQERMLRRVGGRENIPIDVRIISATNRNLASAVAEGKFRADLLFRLRVVPLQIPELRERGGDIAILLDYFLRRQTERCGIPKRHFTDEAMRALLAYHWPGNVRELENAVEYALAIGVDEELGVNDLPPYIVNGHEGRHEVLKERTFSHLPLAEVERRYILSALQHYGGHQIKTAAALGIDRRTLYRKLQQYEVVTSRQEKNLNMFWPREQKSERVG